MLWTHEPTVNAVLGKSEYTYKCMLRPKTTGDRFHTFFSIPGVHDCPPTLDIDLGTNPTMLTTG